MPIPVTTPPTSLDQCSISTSDAIIKLIQIILRARLGTEYECAQNHLHDHTSCCFHLKHYHLQRIRGSFTVIINILQQKKTSTTTSGTLLERWIISLDSSTTTPDSNSDANDENTDIDNNNPTITTTTTADETDAILLLQAVYSHTRLMPLHTLLSNNNLKKSDLASMITVDNSSRSRCYSKHASLSPSTVATDTTTMNPDDFSHTAHIKTHQFFPRGHLRLQVVYQDNLVDEVPISCGVAMRRLSRLSLSAIEDDTDMHEHTDNDSNNNFLHVNYNHNSQYHQQLQQQQHFNPLLQHQGQSPPNNDSYHHINTIISHDNHHPHNSHNNNNYNNKATISASIPIPNMQYTHHHGLVAYSTSPSASFGATRAPWATSIPSATSHLHQPLTPFQQRRTSWTGDHPGGSLVGSYEESLLSGRMSAMPSKPIFFQAQIGVLGKECKPSLRCPPHRSVTFPAFFYDMQEQLIPPYVGTVDLIPPYRLPPKGQLQIVIKNPNKTAVKLFLIPYDVSDMPKNTKTFLRQKSYDGHSLRYAVQVQLCRTEKRRVYLYKHIRVVFANRISDSREKLKVTCEGPHERGPLTKTDLDLLSTL